MKRICDVQVLESLIANQKFIFEKVTFDSQSVTLKAPIRISRKPNALSTITSAMLDALCILQNEFPIYVT